MTTDAPFTLTCGATYGYGHRDELAAAAAELINRDGHVAVTGREVRPSMLAPIGWALIKDVTGTVSTIADGVGDKERRVVLTACSADGYPMGVSVSKNRDASITDAVALLRDHPGIAYVTTCEFRGLFLVSTAEAGQARPEWIFDLDRIRAEGPTTFHRHDLAYSQHRTRIDRSGVVQPDGRGIGG